jgi:hypothetical protein
LVALPLLYTYLLYEILDGLAVTLRCNEGLNYCPAVADILEVLNTLYKRLDAAKGITLYRIWRMPVLYKDLCQID